MGSIERVEQRIAELVAASGVPEDPGHSRNTLEWLLELEPDAGAALRIAALGHDVERAIETRKVRREGFADYDAFKAAHAQNGAEILGEILDQCGVRDASLTQERAPPSSSTATPRDLAAGANVPAFWVASSNVPSPRLR